MRPRFGQLAQLVEQRIENPRVRGSIPRLATKYSKTPALTGWRFAFWLLCSLSIRPSDQIAKLPSPVSPCRSAHYVVGLHGHCRG